MEYRLKCKLCVSMILTLCIAHSSGAQQASTEVQPTAVSGDLVTETTRNLPDGTVQTSRKVQKYLRDIDKSTRIEDTDKVVITNVTLHKLYILRLRDKVAQEMDLPSASAPSITIDRPRASTNPTLSAESLGTAEVSGVKAHGKSVRLDSGNHRESKLETWHSDALDLPMRTVVHNDSGTTTTTFVNIRPEAALDRNLFSIPNGFVVRQNAPLLAVQKR